MFVRVFTHVVIMFTVLVFYKKCRAVVSIAVTCFYRALTLTTLLAHNTRNVIIRPLVLFWSKVPRMP